MSSNTISRVPSNNYPALDTVIASALNSKASKKIKCPKCKEFFYAEVHAKNILCLKCKKHKR